MSLGHSPLYIAYFKIGGVKRKISRSVDAEMQILTQTINEMKMYSYIRHHLAL